MVDRAVACPQLAIPRLVKFLMRALPSTAGQSSAPSRELISSTGLPYTVAPQ